MTPPTLAQLKAASARSGRGQMPPDLAPGTFPMVRLDDVECDQIAARDRLRRVLLLRRLAAAWCQLILPWLAPARSAIAAWPPLPITRQPAAADLPSRAQRGRAVVAACPHTGPPLAAAARVLCALDRRGP
jgi:hypothetical protein